MSFTSSYVMAGIGTFFILFWLFLYIKYRNAYGQVIDAIDKKKFMFGEIYFIGFGFITLFHINIKTERGSKKIKEISEIYGRKYAEFYHYVITGGSIAYFLTLLPMGFCLGAIANNVMLGVLGVVASALLMEYMSGEIKKNVNERREDILEDLPQMLSKFTLLINAGLIVRDAWFKVAYANDRPIYKEMQEACVEMNNGVPVREAVFHFADRCSVADLADDRSNFLGLRVDKHTLQNIHSDINKKEHTEKHDRKNKRCLNDRHSALFVLDVFAFLPEYPVQFNTDHPYKNLCLCVCIFCLSRISPQQKAVSCFHINNSL